jgi:hypothetical protein
LIVVVVVWNGERWGERRGEKILFLVYFDSLFLSSSLLFHSVIKI